MNRGRCCTRFRSMSCSSCRGGPTWCSRCAATTTRRRPRTRSQQRATTSLSCSRHLRQARLGPNAWPRCMAARHALRLSTSTWTGQSRRRVPMRTTSWTLAASVCLSSCPAICPSTRRPTTLALRRESAARWVHSWAHRSRRCRYCRRTASRCALRRYAAGRATWRFHLSRRTRASAGAATAAASLRRSRPCVEYSTCGSSCCAAPTTSRSRTHGSTSASASRRTNRWRSGTSHTPTWCTCRTRCRCTKTC
mmetsp:Transcript_10292/g.31000  ORF Transcript_10292/g.31000 Transcript_10292/m.31000 type:complete len:251 (-) Transcript_10292:868-1620(-)